MLLVIVKLPPRMKFNPFVQPDLFDVFQQVKNQARQDSFQYMSFEHGIGKAKLVVNQLTQSSRVLVLEMNVKHRYDIPNQRNEFVSAIRKANFHVGNFQKEVRVDLPHAEPKAKSVVSGVHTSPQGVSPKPKSVAPQTKKPGALSPQYSTHVNFQLQHLNLVRTLPSLPGMPHIASLQKTVSPVSKQNPPKIQVKPKPVVVAPQGPNQNPPRAQVRPIPPVVAPQGPNQNPPRAQVRPIPPVVAPQGPNQNPPEIQVRPPEVHQNPPEAQVGPVAAIAPQQNHDREDVQVNLPGLRPIPVAALPIPQPGPLGHIPYPDAIVQAAAAKVAEKLDDDLPVECTDPITLEPLTDPVELNRRVYNRDTLLDMIEDGQFNDPFTREIVNAATAKPAHYMLEAMSQHLNVLAGEEPTLLATHKDTNSIPLKGLFDQWENMLQERSSANANKH